MELKNIKMGVLGDSITAGHGVSDKTNMFYEILKRECGIREIYVDGIGGTRIAKQNSNSLRDHNFISRVDNIDSDCDLVLVFGGTNDFGHGDAPIGNEDDDTQYTFYGACNIICQKLIERFPRSQIVFMGPLHRSNEKSKCGDAKPAPVADLYEYTEIIKTVTRKYSIPFLDLMSAAGITPLVPIQKELFMPDGLHPNDEGHKRIAACLKGFLLSL